MKWWSANSNAKRLGKGCHGLACVASAGSRSGGGKPGAKGTPFLSVRIAITKQLLSDPSIQQFNYHLIRDVVLHCRQISRPLMLI